MPEENTGIIIMIYEQKSQNSVLCSARRGLARLQRVGLVRERVERVAPVGLCLLHPAQHLLLLPAKLAEALLSSSRLDSATCAFSSASSFSFCLVDRKLALSRLVFLCSLPIGTVVMASRLPVRARGVWFEKYQSKELAESIHCPALDFFSLEDEASFVRRFIVFTRALISMRTSHFMG